MRALNAEGIVGVFAARDYGVVADGHTDDAPAIQRAIQAAVDAGGGQVWLPSDGGPVMVASTIQLQDDIELVIPTGCTLMLAPGANCDVVAASGARRVRITGGGVIDGNRTNQTSGGNGITLANCDDARVEVTVQNCYADGIVLNGCKRPVLDVASNSNGRHGLYLSGITLATGNVVAVNNGQRVAGNGVTLDATSTDAVLSVAATDTQTVKTQQYGVVEVAASGCDRNMISGSLNGNAAGTSSLVGTSSKVVNNVASVATTGSPSTQALGDAPALGAATTAAPLDHKHGVSPVVPVPLVLQQQSGVPAAPPAGYTTLYIATDGRAYTVTPSGAVSSVGERWQHDQSSTTPDGSTTRFNIGTGVASSKVRVFVNGLLRGPTTNYTFTSGNSYVTFYWAPAAGDDVRMDYVAA
jgi:hypothetical protein